MRMWSPGVASVVVGSLAVAGCFGSHGDAGASDAGVAPDTGADAAVDEWYEDTLGWRVQFHCEGGVVCRPPFAGPPDHPVECPDEMIQAVATTTLGRVPLLLAACSEDGARYGSSEVARPIRCTEDGTCGRLEHVEGVPRCVDGICQLPELPVRRLDVLAYCMANAPRPARGLTDPLVPELARAWELANASCPEAGETCTVPAECAWPR